MQPHSRLNLSMRLLNRISLLLAIVLVPFGSSVEAQVVQGRVLNRLDGSPVGRGYVVLRHDNGVEAGRVLTSQSGNFALTAPMSGRFTVRSERIGFQVSESPLLDLMVGDTVSIDLEIAPLAVRLAEISVEEETQCDVSPADDPATQVLWGEVDKALKAAQWSERGGRYIHELHQYRRVTGLSVRRVEEEQMWSQRGSNSRPFASLPPDSLLAVGYVVSDPDSGWVSYYAPDAAVLLDESFQSTHCFSITRKTESGRNLIGLVFRPTRERRLPDIDGTFWVKEETAELSHIEFNFTDIPNVGRREGLGGVIEFLQLPDGAWVVNRWHIRMPDVRRLMGPDPHDPRPRVGIAGFRQRGGEIVRVFNLSNQQLYVSPNLVTVQGSVFDSIRGRMLEGAVVSVNNSPYTATTDAEGKFSFSGIFDGEYQMSFSHPWIDSIGAEHAIGPGILDARPGDSLTVALTVPPISAVVNTLCRRSLFRDRFIVTGSVLDSQGQRVGEGVRVRLTWQDVVFSQLNVNVQNEWMETATDQNGRYTFCNLPERRPIVMETEISTSFGRSMNVRLQYENGYVGQYRIVRGRTVYTETPWDLPVWSVNLDFRDASVMFRVNGTVSTGDAADPVVGAEVKIDGQTITYTDEDGRFSLSLPRTAEGPWRVSISHIAAGDAEEIVNVPEDGATAVEMEVRLTPPSDPDGGRIGGR